MSEEERDYEAEARKQGWAPIDEWKGDPEKYKDAKQFVVDGEKIAGILQDRIKRLEGRIDELNQSTEEFRQFSKKSLEKEKKEKEKLKQELEAARKQAVTEGDGDAFEAADKQLRELEQSNDNQSLPPEAEQFVRDNQWYGKNQKLTAYADGIAERLASQGYSGQAYFSRLVEEVKEAFPEEFENPNKKRSTSVEDGGTKEVENPKARTYENLPADAKKACDRFTRDIPNFTKEDFLATYDWE